MSAPGGVLGNQRALDAMHVLSGWGLYPEFSRHENGTWWASVQIDTGIRESVDAFDTPWEALEALRDKLAEQMREAP